MNNKIIYETDNKNNYINIVTKRNTHEYSLKRNNFNPAKDSPNFFMKKLQLRMKSYYLEEQLNNDPLSLDTM